MATQLRYRYVVVFALMLMVITANAQGSKGNGQGENNNSQGENNNSQGENNNDNGKGNGNGNNGQGNNNDNGKGNGNDGNNSPGSDNGNNGKGKGNGNGNGNDGNNSPGSDNGNNGKGNGNDNKGKTPPSPPYVHTPPSPYVHTPPPPYVHTPPPPYVHTPPPPTTTPSSPPPPTPTSPPPPPPTPTSPPPPPPTPTSPPPPPPPPFNTLSSPPPPTPTSPPPLPPTTSPTPSPPPPTPTPQSSPPPPIPSPPTLPNKAKCTNISYPLCYAVEQTCPSFCPGGCHVDCDTCKPICKCDIPGAVCQDPRFIGGDGIMFYFHGKKDKDFCVVSDNNLHINAHFIGITNRRMTRDFTWVQSIGILYQNHKLSFGALKTRTWDDAVDRIFLTFDGNSIFLPSNNGAKWQSKSTPKTSIARVSAANSVLIEVEGLFQISATVVPITEEDSRVHNYGITKEDCFAHLELGFKFFYLSNEVNGVLGQTYRNDYVSRVKMGVPMPVMGGAREFASSGLLEPDCSVSRFHAGKLSYADGSSIMTEFPGLKCSSGNQGGGVVCKR